MPCLVTSLCSGMLATLVSGLSFQVSLTFHDISIFAFPESGLDQRKRGTHAEGSTLGSLEFCTGALKTRLIFVLGHTNCGALKGATAAYLSQEKRANHALDVLLNELGSVVSEAKSQCGRKATADEIASKAVGP